VALTGGNPEQGVFEIISRFTSRPICFNADGSLATRPTIGANAPGGITYGAPFSVPTPDAANIASVVLMKPGSVTHSFDMDQRYVGLTFTAGSGSLTVTGPPNSNVAPPAYYMLFLVNKAELLPCELGAGLRSGPRRWQESNCIRIRATPRYIVQRKHVTESALPMRKEMHIITRKQFGTVGCPMRWAANRAFWPRWATLPLEPNSLCAISPASQPARAVQVDVSQHYDPV